MSRLLLPRPPPLAAHFLPPTAASVLCTYSTTLKPCPKPSILPPMLGAGAFRRRPATDVRCMANPRRVKMVSKQIWRELADMLLTDNVLRYAIVPEAALGADRYLSSIATISDVDVSGDLQVVKVYVSVFGDERGRDVAIAGLKAKAKYVRGELGKRMKLRLTPEIRFIEDDSIERGSRVIAILDKIKNEKRLAESQNKEETGSADQPQDESDWEVDDPDEGVIYVK